MNGDLNKKRIEAEVKAEGVEEPFNLSKSMTIKNGLYIDRPIDKM